jgi:hypothetical protein
MKPHIHLPLAVIIGGLMGCGPLKSPPPKIPKPGEKKELIVSPKLVGQITSLQADQRFVLIQSYGRWEMATGAILTTRGPDARSANLRVTGEKLGEFAAADLQSGTVEKGDAVYSQHTPLPPGTTASEEPILSEKPPSAIRIEENN